MVFFVSLQDQRWNNYEKFDDALVRLKASKDINSFKNSAKAIHSDLKVETQAIDDLAGSLRTLSAEVADKIKELQKLDGYEQIEDEFRIFFKTEFLFFFLQYVLITVASKTRRGVAV